MLLDDAQITAAVQQQEQLSKIVICRDELAAEIKTVARVDVAYDKNSNRLIAAITVLDATSLVLLHMVSYHGEATFPYVPGLFSFRELPAIMGAFEQLKTLPDLIVCDGQGVAHPRRFGLTCHLGVVTGVPTIGCAKTRLIGEYASLAAERGSYEQLWDKSEIIGRALRTQTGVNPVFVSIGHKVSLETATAWVMHLAPVYRLPETTRTADHAVKALLHASSVSQPT